MFRKEQIGRRKELYILKEGLEGGYDSSTKPTIDIRGIPHRLLVEATSLPKPLTIPCSLTLLSCRKARNDYRPEIGIDNIPLQAFGH